MSSIVIPFIGGLAMFIYGMNIMADGLQHAAGSKMKKILEEIQDGTFASKFITEANNGWAHFKAKRAIEANHQLEKVGEGIRAMYSWNGDDKYAEK